MSTHFGVVDCTSVDELMKRLAATSLEVPKRTNGRTTEQTERWTICRLLSTLGALKRLVYPLSVLHVDKPDFTVSMSSARVGIEVTEAIHRDYARCVALAEHEKPDAVIDASLFRWGDPEKTLAQLRAIVAASQLTGPGWAGDSVESEWAIHIASIIASKRAKLPSYRQHDLQWLAIYDNLPLPNVNLALAVQKLQRLLQPWNDKATFDEIFVEHGPVIVALTGQSVCFLELNDLW